MSKPAFCNKCARDVDIEEMTMKMGGLLCPKCRVILYQPYVDEEYFEEYRRRNKEREENESNGKASQQGSD